MSYPHRGTLLDEGETGSGLWWCFCFWLWFLFGVFLFGLGCLCSFSLIMLCFPSHAEQEPTTDCSAMFFCRGTQRANYRGSQDNQTVIVVLSVSKRESGTKMQNVFCCVQGLGETSVFLHGQEHVCQEAQVTKLNSDGGCVR